MRSGVDHPLRGAACTARRARIHQPDQLSKQHDRQPALIHSRSPTRWPCTAGVRIALSTGTGGKKLGGRAPPRRSNGLTMRTSTRATRLDKRSSITRLLQYPAAPFHVGPICTGRKRAALARRDYSRREARSAR